jgi:hypothetical protein
MKDWRSTHGLAHSAEYQVWADMIQRCTNPKNLSWRDYGGRGIAVCDRWRQSFAVFYEDMGARPKGLTLERTRNDEGYSPGNCQWATRSTQNFNRRSRNATGIQGVFWEAARQRYRAFRGEHLGHSTDFFEACCLRKSAEARYAR